MECNNFHVIKIEGFLRHDFQPIDTIFNIHYETRRRTVSPPYSVANTRICGAITFCVWYVTCCVSCTLSLNFKPKNIFTSFNLTRFKLITQVAFLKFYPGQKPIAEYLPSISRLKGQCHETKNYFKTYMLQVKQIFYFFNSQCYDLKKIRLLDVIFFWVF